MLALEPDAIYLTHWSRVEDVQRLGATLLRLVDRYEAIGRESLAAHGDDPSRLQAAVEPAIDALLLGEISAHGCTLAPDAVRALLAIDIPLNAAGIVAWLLAGARTAS
jgi:hypothetical protein